MNLRRRVALVWGTILTAAVGAGCTAIVGTFNVGGSADGGTSDATTDESAGDGGGESSTTDTGPTGDTGPMDGGSHDGGNTCTPGASCALGPCAIGAITCDAGASSCTQTSTVTNGTKCDAGAVCDNGACVGCAAGKDCSEAGSCYVSSIACGSGMAVCTQTGPAPNGQSCGTNLYCDNGSCNACTNGNPCAPTAKPCDNGSVACVDGGLTCNDLGTPAGPGTSCGSGQVCDGNGNCVACTSGNQCNPAGNACQTGFTSCATGMSTCTNLTNVGGGMPCGPNEVCDGNGNCIACTAGSQCNPSGNTCETGTTQCSSGTPTCTNLTPVMAGTSCGSNKECDGNGNCVTVCSAATCPSGCCNPVTQACVLYANQTSGTCGHGGAQCHSCAVGSSTPACSTTNGTCAGTIIGQIGTYSDVVDLDSDGTYVYFVDASNEQVAQVSAYGLGTPVLLSAAISGLVNVAYDPVSSVVVFDAQASATTTGLWKATPNSANSATKFATPTGTPADNGLAISSLGSIDVLGVTSSTTVVPSNCTITGSCTSLGTISTSIIGGVTWAANQADPYFADYTNNKLTTWVNSCSCYTTFASPTAPSSPTNDGTYVYWFQGSGTLQLQRQAISGGSVQSLGIYGTSNQVNNLATDGKYVYWAATNGGVNGIYYMPVAGGTAQLLTTATGQLLPVKVHKENMTGQMVVYYGDNGTAALMKVIAPP